MADYPYTNDDHGSPRYGQHYYEKPANVNGVAGEEHVYEDGATEFVPNPATSNSDVVSTGGVPNIPVAASVASPTVVNSTPPSSPSGTGGTPAPAPTFTPPAAVGSSPSSLDGGTLAPSDPATTPVVVGSNDHGAPAGPTPSSDPAGGAQAPVYPTPSPVVVGSAAHGTTSGSLPSSDPTGGTSAPAMEGGNTYTIVHGDTLSGIAAANNMSTAQIEELNPQIKDPDLIFPGQKVNLGGGSTDSSAGSGSSPLPVVGEAAQPSTGGSGNPAGHDNAGSGITGGASAPGSGAIGFPEKSTYPPVGSDMGNVGNADMGAKAEGWVDGTGNATPDVAKAALDLDTHTSTDPLHIDDKK